LYSREAKPASSVAAVYACRIENLSDIDTHEALRQLLRDPTIASRIGFIGNTITTVRTGTIVKPGSDAAVFFRSLRQQNFGGDHGLQFDVLRARPARRREDRRRRSGAKPYLFRCKAMAVTDCLNFGNPYKPEISGNCVKRLKE